CRRVVGRMDPVGIEREVAAGVAAGVVDGLRCRAIGLRRARLVAEEDLGDHHLREEEGPGQEIPQPALAMLRLRRLLNPTATRSIGLMCLATYDHGTSPTSCQSIGCSSPALQVLRAMPVPRRPIRW